MPATRTQPFRHPHTAFLGVLTLLSLLGTLLSPAFAQDAPEPAAAFDVERINGGIVAPEGLDRSTPRAAMEGFVDSAEMAKFEVAVHFLNLAGMEEAAQPTRGPEIARQFHEVVKRKLWIDWGALPDRDDGLDAFASADTPEAGEPRRSLRLGVIDVGDRPVEIRINRYQPAEGPAVWLISERTVGYVPALYEQHGPRSMERMLPEALQEEGFWSMPLWQTIAVPLILAIAVFTAFLVHRIVCAIGERMASSELKETSGARWLPQIVMHSGMPIGLLAGASVVAVVTANFFSFSGPANVVVTSLITITLVVAVSLVLLRIIGTILDIVTSNFVSSIDDEENTASRELFTNISVARRIVILVALFLGGAVVMAQLNLSQTLGISLLASAGVVSLILGFAAQTVLGNILASIQIAIAKPIRIGDAVVYKGEWGYIEEINFTYILIRTWDYRRIIVPVRTFVSEPFENWSMRNAAMIAPVEIKLDPTADIDVLRKAFEGLLRGDEDWDGQQEPEVVVVAHDEHALTARFYASARNPSAAWDLHCRLRERLFAFLREEEDGRWLPRQRHQMLGGDGRPAPANASSAPSEPRKEEAPAAPAASSALPLPAAAAPVA